MASPRTGTSTGNRLYSPEERQRRDASVWTLVQGVLAPVQFLAFLVSLVLLPEWGISSREDQPSSAV